MQGRSASKARRVANILTVRGHVVSKYYLESNIGWLLVEDLRGYEQCTYFELHKGLRKYVVRNAY